MHDQYEAGGELPLVPSTAASKSRYMLPDADLLHDKKKAMRSKHQKQHLAAAAGMEQLTGG